MKALLAFLLIILAFLACYVEDIYLYLRPPRAGESIPITIRSQRPFTFNQEKAFGSKRNVALSQYVPLYAYVPDRSAAARRKIEELIRRIPSFQTPGGPDTGAFIRFLKGEFGVELSPEQAAQVLLFPDLNSLLQGILTLQESILQGKIVENPEPLKGKKTVEVLYPESSRTVVFPSDEIITLDKARGNLRSQGFRLFWQVNPGVLELILQISSAALLPNLQYDQEENDRRIEEIMMQYPSRVVQYQPGEVIVPFGKTLSEGDVLLLMAHQEAAEKNFYGRAPWILLAITLSTVLFVRLLLTARPSRWRKKTPCRLILAVLMTIVFLLKTVLVITPFPILVLPFAMLPLLLVLLNLDRVSIILTTALGALLVSFFSGRTLDTLLFFAIGGLISLLAYPAIRKRSHVLVPSLAVGLINVVIVTFGSINWEPIGSFLLGLNRTGGTPDGAIFGPLFFANTSWAFAGGLAAGPAALLLLPVFEMGRARISTFKLNKYSDLQHPLLRDLLTKTPGTYQHTMAVAHLAQAAGDAIGADTLLLRIGAYFHDVGKMMEPGLFVENQFDGKNPHEELDPFESARVIMEHVARGKKIAEQAGLPEAVVDFIPQHHGTLLIEYFYDKALKACTEQGESGDNGVREEDFRYPGPKPQSIEAAILMIVDAVEATSRTIQQPTREKMEALVNRIVQNRIADGQFSECEVTTRELFIITRALVNSLEASYHTRVEYPWQKADEEAETQGVAQK